MEVEVCWSGQSRQGIEDQMSRDERRLLRLTAVLDEPFAELADADRALHGMWPPPWATAFQKDMFGQLRDAYRDAVQLQSVARTEVRGAEDEDFWIGVLQRGRQRFEDAAGLYWRLFPSIM